MATENTRSAARVPAVNVARTRRRLGLSQAAFARTFGLDVATLRNWEQGRAHPDGPARVLLVVIDREPRAVMRSLEVSSSPQRRLVPGGRR